MQPAGYAKDYASQLIIFARLLDAALIFASSMLCFYILRPYKNFPDYSGWMPNGYLNAVGVAILLSLWWFPKFNVYRSWRGASLFSEFKPLIYAWASTIVGLIAFIFFTKTADDYSRHWLGLWFITAFAVMGLVRLLLRMLLRQMRRRGRNLRYIVLVGNAEKCIDIAQRIDQAPWLGLAVQGYFGENDSAKNHQNIKQLGQINDLIEYLQTNAVDQVWIAMSLRDIDTIEALNKNLAKTAVEVLLVPDILGWRLLNHSVVQINGLPLINIAVSPINGINVLAKWLEDKILATLILILISPLMLLIAIAVKLTSPGPVLYSQERVSWSGKRFKMLKFRTMPKDADLKDGSPIWGQARSKQPTKVGVFLRKTSLDELPQFINVLKGDMSIVGPRPERPMFVEEFRHEIDGYMQKHLVKAGITGWAQVNGWRGDTCLKTRIEHDLYYIEHWSFWLDLKIIILTIFKGFVNCNAN